MDRFVRGSRPNGARDNPPDAANPPDSLDPPYQPEPCRKRARITEIDSPISQAERFVMVSCFDEPERLMEVDLALLQPFSCRLFCTIRRDPPCIDVNGKQFWRTGLTRGLLQTLIRSLTMGVLTVAKTVSVADALAMMDYENISLGNRIKPPPVGIAFCKRAETTHQMILTTCEQIASCLATWPRLETCLDASLHGNLCLNSVSATRAWIRFCTKPTPRTASTFPTEMSFMSHIARKWPSWLYLTLTAIGVLHARLVKDEVVCREARDGEAYKALESAVEANALGTFFPVAYDISKSRTSQSASIRKDVSRGERFANEMRQIITEGSMCKDKSALSYANAVFCLSELILNISPSPASLFGGACADENGKTSERNLLKKALQQRGISLIRWADDEKGPSRPLLFPSGWMDARTPSSCTMLLEFQTK